MDESRAELVERFFTGTGQRYDLAVRLGTLGWDCYWKRRLLAKVPPSQAILDLACGTGIVTFALARRNPKARLVGVDLTEDYLQIARQKAQKLGVNAEFIHGNAETVSLHETFDCITASYLSKYVDARRLLENITPILKSGGVIVLHDFLYPRHPVARAIWHGYNRLLNFFGRRLFPEWKEVFDNNLTALIVRSNWLEEFAQAFRQHGYVDIEIERLTLGSAAIISARKG
ncbi:MAG: class I SAM-dependent methyltransferase [candidate division KSB1 bacterium]|nr:class I SAM-dependent methyltransferase [candidate division KSB1 bacterium]MDZ7303468.1 class I SAM-dependent methyltransferase [candidate division KSB1 bacterium]MDZ7312550.1 class I SAM-dependent methyltransferase [candidate division KSB1 bacterium]